MTPSSFLSIALLGFSALLASRWLVSSGMQSEPVYGGERPRAAELDSNSVPAALGGAGFWRVAADSGWTTGTIAPEDYQYVADTNALKGGTITIAIDAFPLTLRPYGKNENTQETRLVYNMVYEGLLVTDPLTLDFLPSLATHWKVGSDGRTYWFRINPAARFSDGHPVTSEDVIATYRLARDPGIESPATNAFFEGFEMPVASSPYIVQVRSKSVNWKDLLYFGGTPILPAHIIGRLSGREYLKKHQYAMPAGTGPYSIIAKDLKKGKSLTLRRRADWWQKDDPLFRGEFNFDAIHLVAVPDPEEAYWRFLKGEFDLCRVGRVQKWITDSYHEEVERGQIVVQRIHSRSPTGFAGIAFNTKVEPFDDIRVRQAIGLLFDRETILGSDSRHYDFTNSIYPGTEFENPDNPRHRFDPERALQLLEEAGFTELNDDGILVRNGKPFIVEMLIYSGQEPVLEMVKADLERAGIRIDLKPVDPNLWFAMLKEQKFRMAYMGWGGLTFPNPITSFHSSLAERLPSNNITSFRNPRVDSLIERELRTFDPMERRRMLREIDSTFSASYHYAYSWHSLYETLVYRNRFGMPRHVLSRIGDWRDILSLWWVDPERDRRLRASMRDTSMRLERPAEQENLYWLHWTRERARKPAR